MFRPLRWLVYGSLGIPLVLALLLFSNLLTYTRLSHEQEVGQISFRRLGNGHYLATFVSPSGRERYELDGDQWELDARVIKWKPWANVLGLDAAYRLERLSGRFSDAGRAQLSAPMTHQLAPSSLIDVWALAQRQRGWVPVLDAVYGSSVYLPMGDGLTYRIGMSQSGLLARPQDVETN